VDVEDAAGTWDHLDRGQGILFPLLEDARRQTGGVRARPSGDAVLDPDVVSSGHRSHSITLRRRFEQLADCLDELLSGERLPQERQVPRPDELVARIARDQKHR